MKRYCIVIDDRGDGIHEPVGMETPAGQFVAYADHAALLRAVAEEVMKFPHDSGCPAAICEECGWNENKPWHKPNDDDPDDYCRFKSEGDCNCPRGRALALLEVNT